MLEAKEFTMRNRSMAVISLAAVFVTGSLLSPSVAAAQNSKESHHRQKTKNDWRNIAIGSGALSLYGLLKHDSTLTFLGAAGSLYSASRYEHDRKSQSKTDHARASYFSKTHFYRDGKRFNRKTVWKNGHKYYRFVRG